MNVADLIILPHPARAAKDPSAEEIATKPPGWTPNLPGDPAQEDDAALRRRGCPPRTRPHAKCAASLVKRRSRSRASSLPRPGGPRGSRLSTSRCQHVLERLAGDPVRARAHRAPESDDPPLLNPYPHRARRPPGRTRWRTSRALSPQGRPPPGVSLIYGSPTPAQPARGPVREARRRTSCEQARRPVAGRMRLKAPARLEPARRPRRRQIPALARPQRRAEDALALADMLLLEDEVGACRRRRALRGWTAQGARARLSGPAWAIVNVDPSGDRAHAGPRCSKRVPEHRARTVIARPAPAGDLAGRVDSRDWTDAGVGFSISRASLGLRRAPAARHSNGCTGNRRTPTRPNH